MAAFRILNQFPVYLGDNGLPLAGGYLRFYESGTTTPKDVFGDQALTVNNGPQVELDSTGRAVHDLWGDGSYRVRLYAADDTLVGEVDDVEIPGGDAATIPELTDGYFLTNNGALLLWAPIRQLPDPTGQDGKMVVADGDGYILQPIPEPPEPPEPDIEVGTTSVIIGDGGAAKFKILTGSTTLAETGTHRATANVTFPEAFDTCLAVMLQVATYSSTSFNATGTTSATAKTGAGFTLNYDVNIDDNNGGWNMVNPVTVEWVAIGLVS